MSGMAKKAVRCERKPLAGSEGARKTAAVLLEVLSGLRSPTEGAEALGISAMRYYLLERRGLEGMVRALEPRPKGKQRRPEAAVAELSRRNAQLQRELGRMQALVRAGQRIKGLSAPPSREKKKGERLRRRPGVRAVKTVALLRRPEPAGAQPAGGEVS